MIATAFAGTLDLREEQLSARTQNFGNALAQLFADGKFLVEDIETKIKRAFNEYVKIQNLMIAGMLIKNYDYVVAVDTGPQGPNSYDDVNSSWLVVQEPPTTLLHH